MNVALVAVRTVVAAGVGAGRGLLLAAYVSALVGALLGANNAATAATPTDAIVPADDVTDALDDVGSADVERVDRPLIPDALERDRPHPAVRGGVDTIVRLMLGLMFATANTVGPFLYAHAWIPTVIVKAVIYLAMAPVLAIPLLRARRFLG